MAWADSWGLPVHLTFETLRPAEPVVEPLLKSALEAT